MSADRDSDRARPDSTPDDDVYTRNEEGKPRYAEQSRGEGAFENDREGGFPVVRPQVYGPAILVGVVLFLFPEPVTSAVGLLLVVAGLFLAVIDTLYSMD